MGGYCRGNEFVHGPKDKSPIDQTLKDGLDPKKKRRVKKLVMQREVPREKSHGDLS